MRADDVLAHVGVGSNLGDRAATIARAVESLNAAPGVTVAAVSSLVETAAVGGPANSPPFLNAAVAVRTALGPHELLAVLLAIESKLGRVRRERWGPRTLDLDVLLYDDQLIHTADLVVPHPLLRQRRFVLQPLAEIAPDAVDPETGRTIVDLLRALDDAGV